VPDNQSKSEALWNIS